MSSLPFLGLNHWQDPVLSWDSHNLILYVSINEDLDHEEFKDSDREIRSLSKLPFQEEVCLQEALSLLDCELRLLQLYFKLYQVNQKQTCLA